MKLAVPLAAVLVCRLASAVTAGEALEIALWPGVAPGSAESELVEAYDDCEIDDGTDVPRDREISGVTKPTVTIHLPDPDRANGTAVIIVPGGGFNILAIDKEGHDVARWLNQKGIAGIVVKYRLPDLDVGLYVRNGAIVDVQRAIRLTRQNAGAWRIDPKRIGLAGFSAGGYLTALAGTCFDAGDPAAEDPVNRIGCRPDFIVPIYPLVVLQHPSGRSPRRLAQMLGPEPTEDMIKRYSPDLRVTPETPPTLLVHADDDGGVSSEHSLLFYLALKRAGVPAELHIYARGGHGYGIRQRGLPISAWRDRWLDWMRQEGFLTE